jgi:hypothetical protein
MFEQQTEKDGQYKGQYKKGQILEQVSSLYLCLNGRSNSDLSCSAGLLAFIPMYVTSILVPSQLTLFWSRLAADITITICLI